MKSGQVWRYVKIVLLISLAISTLIHFNSILGLFSDGSIGMHGNMRKETFPDVIEEIFVTAMVAFCTFMINYYIIRPLSKLGNVGFKRIAASTILTLVSVYLLSDLFFAIKHLLNDVNNPGKFILLYFFRDLFTATIVLTCVYVIKLFFDRQAILIENEKLLRENLQSQYESLKNQLSPHFLFNSLTALKTLIEESPDVAQEYVNNLSKALRYTLQSNLEQLVILKEEMDFTDSYLFLIKLRFDTNLVVKTSIDEKYSGYKLPPLTIQTLVENAVKHNEISRRNPLTITIYTTDNESLVVTNNLQEKVTREDGTGIGLTNLAKQFQLLLRKDISISKENNEFRVEVPLIKP
jgi:LytS/YehU family sensor histidine kinase